MLIVEDSPVAAAVLRRMLAGAPDIEVVGVAVNGREALEQIPTLQPTVICTDWMMPIIDGLELTREVMVRFPTPILVISSTVDPTEPAKSYPILEAGAVDVFPKPTAISGPEFERQTRDLVGRIRVLSGVHVFRRYAPTATPRPADAARPSSTAPVPARPRSAPPAAPPPGRVARIVAIGASTGGPVVLRDILAQLPAGFPLPILCVQHISTGFLQGFVEWLGTSCSLPVRIAREGERPKPGAIHFPQENRHLELDGMGRILASDRPPVEGHRPSVTATFESVAGWYGSGAVGVLLTGMGGDGAEGMVAIQRAGGLTLAQDEETSVVFGMPRRAIERGAAQHVLPPDEIARHLRALRPPRFAE